MATGLTQASNFKLFTKKTSHPAPLIMSNNQANGRRDPNMECTCLSNCSHFVQHGLETIFGNIGRIVGRNPWPTIFLSVTLTCLFGLGFMNWTTESRTEKLWVTFNLHPPSLIINSQHHIITKPNILCN